MVRTNRYLYLSLLKTVDAQPRFITSFAGSQGERGIVLDFSKRLLLLHALMNGSRVYHDACAHVTPLELVVCRGVAGWRSQ
jgi:hypothetical protein